MILEWDVPFQLVPSVNEDGTTPGLPGLFFNELVSVGTRPLGYFMLDPAKCQAGAARRITRNNLAQADGEITHRKFKTGYVIELNLQFWEDVSDPACAGTLREMGDLLDEYLEAVSNNNGQLIWQPSGWPDPDVLPNPRMLDQARSMGPSGNDDTGSSFVSVVTEKDDNAKLFDVTFAFLSPLPYLTDFMDYPTSPDAVAMLEDAAAPSWCDAGEFGIGYTATTVTNAGNTAYSPVLRVYGPFVGFSLVNFSVVDEIGNPLAIVYDSSLPGAPNGTDGIPDGSYLEIDTFTQVVQVHNAGGGTDNGKPGIDPTTTDYFQLVPGTNDIGLCLVGGPGAQPAEVIYRNAWI